MVFLFTAFGLAHMNPHSFKDVRDEMVLSYRSKSSTAGLVKLIPLFVFGGGGVGSRGPRCRVTSSLRTERKYY